MSGEFIRFDLTEGACSMLFVTFTGVVILLMIGSEEYNLFDGVIVPPPIVDWGIESKSSVTISGKDSIATSSMS